MKYAPLILSLSCLASGVALLIVGRNDPTLVSLGTGMIGAFLGQFAPAPHTALVPAKDGE